LPDQINPAGLGGVGPVGPPKPPVGPGGAGEVDGKSFAKFLEEKIGEVDQLQQNADKAIQDLATGKEQDITKVVSAAEKANLAFQMMLQIRNKLVDAYQEIMRIRT
jgi:flagellar hook-basal body complex protein FliE